MHAYALCVCAHIVVQNANAMPISNDAVSVLRKIGQHQKNKAIAMQMLRWKYKKHTHAHKIRF